MSGMHDGGASTDVPGLKVGHFTHPELVVGALAAEVVTRAVIRGVLAATGLPGLPSASELGVV